MSAEPDDRDDLWAYTLDCTVCGAEDALIEVLVCRECGMIADDEDEARTGV